MDTNRYAEQYLQGRTMLPQKQASDVKPADQEMREYFVTHGRRQEDNPFNLLQWRGKELVDVNFPWGE